MKIHLILLRTWVYFPPFKCTYQVNLHFLKLISYKRSSLFEDNNVMPSFHRCSTIRYLELNPPRRFCEPHNTFAFNTLFRKHFYAIRFYLRAIDIYLAERTRSSCVHFPSKREKKKTHTQTRETIGRNWPGYLCQIFTPKSIPSLIVPQSSHCRSIERSREPLSAIQDGQRHAFPAILVFVPSISK